MQDDMINAITAMQEAITEWGAQLERIKEKLMEVE